MVYVATLEHGNEKITQSLGKRAFSDSFPGRRTDSGQLKAAMSLFAERGFSEP